MIGIIFIGDLKYCPYLKIYTEILNEHDKEYEVLYWSREPNGNILEKTIAFQYESDLNENKFNKVIGLMKYRKWLLKRIKSEKYEKIIVLSTLSGMIIADKLLMKYRNKYIFDIRDYSYEHISLFKKLESTLIENSYVTGISSKGFLNFLPESNKYEIVHNFNDFEIPPNNYDRRNSQRLNVVWLGAVRYFDHQKKIINHLANDDRFIMTYHGSGPDLEKYKEYIKEIKAKNIIFTGEYNNKEKNEMLKSADILNNSYYTPKEMETKFAISNKYYDGIFHYLPQLGEMSTYKADLIEMNNLGFIIDVEERDFATVLYNNYTMFSTEKFIESATVLQKVILKENDDYKKNILEFIHHAF